MLNKKIWGVPFCFLLPNAAVFLSKNTTFKTFSNF